MSPDDQGGRNNPERHVTQYGRAAKGGRVMQAGRNQYILNLGNAAWVTVPVALAVAVALVLYVTIGRTPHASGSPATDTASHGRGSPVTVALAYDKHDVANGQGSCMYWVFRRPLASVPTPAENLPNETWAHRYGGVDMGTTNFKLTVQGLTTTAVQLIDFRVIDLKREPALHGTTVVSSDGCGPAAEAGFEIGLGSNPPVIAPVSGLDNGTAKKIPFPFEVSSTDIQQFQVEALNSLKAEAKPCGCDVSWRLALDWSYEGKTGNSVIDDNGKPFQTFFPLGYGTPAWFDANGVWKRM